MNKQLGTPISLWTWEDQYTTACPTVEAVIADLDVRQGTALATCALISRMLIYDRIDDDQLQVDLWSKLTRQPFPESTDASLNDRRVWIFSPQSLKKIIGLLVHSLNNGTRASNKPGMYSFIHLVLACNSAYITETDVATSTATSYKQAVFSMSVAQREHFIPKNPNHQLFRARELMTLYSIYPDLRALIDHHLGYGTLRNRMRDLFASAIQTIDRKGSTSLFVAPGYADVYRAFQYLRANDTIWNADHTNALLRLYPLYQLEDKSLLILSFEGLIDHICSGLLYLILDRQCAMEESRKKKEQKQKKKARIDRKPQEQLQVACMNRLLPVLVAGCTILVEADLPGFGISTCPDMLCWTKGRLIIIELKAGTFSAKTKYSFDFQALMLELKNKFVLTDKGKPVGLSQIWKYLDTHFSDLCHLTNQNPKTVEVLTILLTDEEALAAPFSSQYVVSETRKEAKKSYPAIIVQLNTLIDMYYAEESSAPNLFDIAFGYLGYVRTTSDTFVMSFDMFYQASFSWKPDVGKMAAIARETFEIG